MKKLKPRVVLVVGAGGARGFAHVGVLRVLEQNHIPVDLIVGTSAGSIVGALYADKPNAKAVKKLLVKAKRDEVIDFSYLNIVSGPISGSGLQTFLVTHVQSTSFGQLQIPFIALAVDLASGKLHPFGSGSIAPAVNASSAAPPFFRPVKRYGHTYADGGLIDPVSVDVAKCYHPQIIIAVEFDSPVAKAMSTNSVAVFLRGFAMMLAKLNDASAQGADVIIRPGIGELDMFEQTGRDKIMRAGELATLKALSAIKKLLAVWHTPSSATN